MELTNLCWDVEPYERKVMRLQVEKIKVVGSNEIPVRHQNSCGSKTIMVKVKSIDTSKWYHGRTYRAWLPRSYFETYPIMLAWFVKYVSILIVRARS